MTNDFPRLGATYLCDGRTEFFVWAPRRRQVDLRLVEPRARDVAMQSCADGYYRAVVDDVAPGATYMFRLDNELERPDPASRFQPTSVHGPTAVTDPRWDWTDGDWFGLPMCDYAVYELHVGTYTGQGTFEAIIPTLPRLRDLGITAIELMPVAQFPGRRNWGYDGVYPFAAQNSYGGVPGLKRLVQAAHQHGLAVILDVVYNHLGPEGNYLHDYGPYFTDHYKTPWGAALNFDGPESDPVRHFFIESALYWQRELHIDALRLDAVHAICDFAAVPFLQELAVATRSESERLNRRFHLIAESDSNDVRLILPPALTGYGLDAQWSDDFHHSLHTLLTKETSGYYADFGSVHDLARACREGYAYTGQYSRHRRRRHGNSPRLAEPQQFVVCSQNHDQVGNRLLGDRLSTLVSFEALKLAAATVILAPFVPMLFMGEEYGEIAPFLYFTDHSDKELVKAVREGRKREHASIGWKNEVPDPQAEETLSRSQLNSARRKSGNHQLLERFYTELFALRRDLPGLVGVSKGDYEVRSFTSEEVVALHYHQGPRACWVLLAFSQKKVSIEAPMQVGTWNCRLASADLQWGGPGPTHSSTIDVKETGRLELAPLSATVWEASR